MLIEEMSAEYTEDEMVALLERSCFPVVLVEGKDDMSIYNWIDRNLFGGIGIVLPCHGRDKLLRLANRRHEYSSTKVVFLADCDVNLVLKNIPNVNGVIWTHGYSVENDLLTSQCVLDLLTEEEKQDFNDLLVLLGEWYICKVIDHAEGDELRVSVHTRRVVDPDSKQLVENCSVSDELKTKYKDVIDRVGEAPERYVRGKNIFDLLLIFLSNSKRASKYSRNNLYELCSVFYERSDILRDRLLEIEGILCD